MASNANLPPGFRFFPTDEELVVHFLQRKASLFPCHPDVIPDLDLYPCDPWDLHDKALVEGNQLYFYSRRTQSRVTSNGYWSPLGIEEPIFSTTSSKKVGVKKHLMFYVGDVQTNWIMQEYRLLDSTSRGSGSGSSSSSSSSSGKSSKRRGHSKNDCSKWVICRVFERNCDEDDDEDGTELSCLDEVFLSLDDLEEISLPN